MSQYFDCNMGTGLAFLLIIDYITPHIHISGEAEGPRSRLSRTAKLALAVTIHNFPEGMAVGVALAGALTADFNIAGALALSLGIAIQTFRKERLYQCHCVRPETHAGNPSA